MQDMLPGDMVVRRSRWGLDSSLVGLVLGRVHSDKWAIMWMLDRHVSFSVHLGDALTVVNTENIDSLKSRGRTVACS